MDPQVRAEVARLQAEVEQRIVDARVAAQQAAAFAEAAVQRLQGGPDADMLMTAGWRQLNTLLEQQSEGVLGPGRSAPGAQLHPMHQLLVSGFTSVNSGFAAALSAYVEQVGWAQRALSSFTSVAASSVVALASGASALDDMAQAQHGQGTVLGHILNGLDQLTQQASQQHALQSQTHALLQHLVNHGPGYFPALPDQAGPSQQPAQQQGMQLQAVPPQFASMAAAAAGKVSEKRKRDVESLRKRSSLVRESSPACQSADRPQPEGELLQGQTWVVMLHAQPDQSLALKGYLLPFELEPSWIIPAQLKPDQQEPSMQQWSGTSWQGPAWAGLTLAVLLHNWDRGLQVAKSSSGQIAPLRVLERPGIRLDWKACLQGCAPAKNVGYMKCVIYQLHRMRMGTAQPRAGVAQPAVSLAEACQELLQLAKAGNDDKTPSLKWLAETFMPRLHRLGEPTPTEYEAKVLDVDGALMFSQRTDQW